MRSDGPVVRVEYIVQSVPARRELRQRLLDQLPQAVVVEDDGPRPPSPWRGYLRCIEAISDEATHALIIQDDTIVCSNFTLAVERLAEIHEHTPLCLFVSASKSKTMMQYRKAAKSQLRYSEIWFQDYCPVVALLWPRSKLAEFMHWWAGNPRLPGMREPYRSDDAVVGSWMKFTRQRVLATVPSLVEHPDDTLSVKWDTSNVPSGTENRFRRAFQFIGDGDPLEINWDV